MQLHIGTLRNNNRRMFEKLGADTGIDSINDLCIAEGVSGFMNYLDSDNILPKTILYTLNPKDNYVLGTMLGNFQRAPFAGKIQFGSGWWFNDNKDGMEQQMRAFANLGMLGSFVGMLTDSRSFVSYPRHEYFRRIYAIFWANGLKRASIRAIRSTWKSLSGVFAVTMQERILGFRICYILFTSHNRQICGRQLQFYQYFTK